MLVHRCTDGEVGDRTQTGEIESAVVSWAVVAYQSGTVKTEDDGQALQGYIVDNLVVGPLHERGVDIAVRLHALGGKASGKSDCMLLGNADIECPGGHLLHHDVEGASCGHGGRDAYDIGVTLGQLDNSVAEDILVFKGFAFRAAFNLHACLGIETPRSVIGHRMPLG